MPVSKSDGRNSPFHRGELEIQSRVGIREESNRQGRISIRKFMPDQHRSFFELLPFLMVGAVDQSGWPVCSMLTGRAGFVHSPTPTTLRIDGLPRAGDPLRDLLGAGLDVGILGIDLATRRRNRMNGKVVAVDSQGFTVEVGQSFGNCPQYIQARELDAVHAGERSPAHPVPANPMSPEFRSAIEKADTFFVASAVGDPQTGGYQVDISHRGGRRGFVKTDAKRLTVPDFSGNNFFNTLGNFTVNPRAGLLFPDFDTGELRYVAGSVEIVWDGDEIKSFKGAQRLWRVAASHGWLWSAALPLRWRFRDYAPTTEQTGAWHTVKSSGVWPKSDPAGRPFRVDRIRNETPSVKSFYLTPADGHGLPAFLPGQHVSVNFPPIGPVSRPYSISSAPGDPFIRVSVKQELGFSRILHETLKVGSVVRLGPPTGKFVFCTDRSRPALLLSAGIGITPMISMAKHLAGEMASGDRRTVLLVHVGRNGRERPFRQELSRYAGEPESGLRVHLILTRPSPDDRFGRDYDSFGRPSVERLSSMIDIRQADIYLCGPSGFMQSTYDMLLAAGIRDRQIFAETFGPSSLMRMHPVAKPDVILSEVRWTSPVVFANSGRTIEWHAGRGSLLEMAEAEGLNPTYGCRSGDCGSCAVRIMQGEVKTIRRPSFTTESGTTLLCCAIPAAPDENNPLTLQA